MSQADHPKIADPDYPIIPELSQRWSPRAFSDRPIPALLIKKLFEAARWAPSSYNEQPWHFIIAQKEDRDSWERLLSVLVEGNQKWAKTAPLLGISIAKKRFDRNDKPNRHYFHDVGLAMGNLLAEATHHGLYAHQMAGYHKDQAAEKLHIPEAFEPVACFAIGYLGEPDQLEEKMAKSERKERSRKPLSELVSIGDWEGDSLD